MTNEAGDSVNSYLHDPFGISLARTETVGTAFGFVGEYGVMNEGTGLEFMRARYYSPEIGRFMTLDPIAVTSLGAYSYANNSPTSFVDPLGLASCNSEDPDIDAAYEIHYADWNAVTSKEFQTWGKRLVGLYAGVLNGVGAAYAYLAGWSESVVLAMKAISWAPELVELFGHHGGSHGSTDSGTGGGSGGPGGPGSPGGGCCGSGGGCAGCGGGSPGGPGGPGGSGSSGTATSGDPNSLIGPAGFGPAGFIAPSSEFPYRVNFENEPMATAPAQRVDITDQLDPGLDWSTFQLTGVGFGDTIIAIPAGSRYFQTAVPMTYNNQTFNVQIELGLNVNTGQVYAHFFSIDPSTQLPPDVLTGFLPPEDGTGRGMGFFSYVVQPKDNLTTGTQIRNVALVTFDLQQPSIATDQADDHDPSQGDPNKQALNTIDAGPPTSSVAPLPTVENSPNFTVSWSGQDDGGGSGVATYTLYVSDNGGPFTPYLLGTTDTMGIFSGAVGHTYAFYSVATDNVGNAEGTPSSAEATTTVLGGTTTALTASIPNPVYGQSLSFMATVSPVIADSPTPTGTVQFLVDGTNFGDPITLVSGMAISRAISTLYAVQHTITADYSGDPNFAATTTALPLIVAPAPLTVTADNQDMGHGDAIPGLTYRIQGFVNGETMSVVQGVPDLSTTASSAARQDGIRSRSRLARSPRTTMTSTWSTASSRSIPRWSMFDSITAPRASRSRA